MISFKCLQKDKSILLPADNYWEQKLNMRFCVEIARYAKLCEKYNRKQYGTLDGVSFITYHDWSSYIIETINSMDVIELTELSHYLRNKERLLEMESGISEKLFIPLLIAIYVPVLLNMISELASEEIKDNGNVFLVAVCMVIAVTILIPAIQYIRGIINDICHKGIKKSFYIDFREIVDKQLVFYQTGVVKDGGKEL